MEKKIADPRLVIVDGKPRLPETESTEKGDQGNTGETEMEVKTTVEFPSRNGYWMKSVWSEDRETLEAVLDENGNPKECSYRDIVEWERKEDEEKIGDKEGWPSRRILEEVFDMDQSAGERMIEKLLFEDESEPLAIGDILSKLGCLDSPGSDNWRRRIVDRLFLDKNVQIKLMASDLAEDWKEIEALKTAIANEDTSWVKWEMELALAHLERQEEDDG